MSREKCREQGIYDQGLSNLPHHQFCMVPKRFVREIGDFRVHLLFDIMVESSLKLALVDKDNEEQHGGD